MRALLIGLLLLASTAFAEPKCAADFCTGMSELDCAKALGVNMRIAKDNDHRNGNHDDQDRLEQAAGGKGKIKDCDEWGKAHGKPQSLAPGQQKKLNN